MGRPDVVVVGAGPVGLSVALGLARRGREVLVLEKAPGTAEHSRAPAIWPRTQEVLAGLGVVERFRAEGILLDRLRLWDADRGRERLSVPLRELGDSTPYPQLLVLPQSRTESLLYDALQGEARGRVLFSSPVVGVRQDGSGVTVTYRGDGGRHEVGARFAVGCDGAHSTVRETLSILLEGDTYGVRAALADVEVDVPHDLPFPRFSTRDGVAVGIRMGAGLWRLILPFAGDEERDLDDRVGSAAVRLFPGVSGPRDYACIWQSEFGLHRKVASTFVRGRVALAGDAAHLNSPVGGQGMNAGIQDAEALVVALAEALDAGDGGPLVRYGRQRRARVEAGVNRFTDRLTRVLLLGRGRALRPALAVARQALRLPPLRRRFLRDLAMLDGA